MKLVSGFKDKTVLSIVKIIAPSIFDALLQSQNVHVKLADIIILVDKIGVVADKGVAATSDGKLTMDEAVELFSDLQKLTNDPIVGELKCYLSKGE